MSDKKVVLYDACIFYSAPLRDFLIRFALTKIIRAKWSETIHEEWIRNLLKNRSDITREALTRTRVALDRAVPDALIEEDRYNNLIPSLELPDVNDRHVLAAAIASKVDIILTFNLKDFPDVVLNTYDMEAMHPDEFVLQQLKLYPATVLECLVQQQKALRKPPVTMPELLHNLRKNGLRQSSEIIRKLMRIES